MRAQPASEHPAATSSDDAQRELERHALRNVRSLVDKLEGAERRGIAGSLRLAALVLAGMAALAAISAFAFWIVRGPVQTHSVTITPGGQDASAPR